MATDASRMPETRTRTRRPLLGVPSRRRHADAVDVPAALDLPVEAVQDDGSSVVVEQRDRLFRRLLASADLLAACVALLTCLSVVGSDAPRMTLLLAVPVMLLASKVQGLYDRDELLVRKTTLDEAPQLFHLSTLYALLVWVLDDALIEGAIGTAQIVTLWAAFFALSFLFRHTARAVARRFAPTERCLFIGDSATYGRLYDKLDCDDVKAKLVGRMSLQRTARRGARATHADELRQLIEWTDVHRVIIEPHVLPSAEMLDLVRAAKSLGVRVSLVPHVHDVVGSSVVFDQIDGMTLLGVRRFGLSRSSWYTKRALDLVGTTLGLIALAPVIALIALAIKLDTRGPVLFRQVRVGRDGRHFRICKFRTMCVDAEERKAELAGQNEVGGGMFKIANDPRVTRVGRILRKTSLDELPQLFNVIAGDMSLVGPRPLVVDEDDLVKGSDRSRLELTPGMTGPWQILASARVPLPEMVKIDYLYIAGWSLWADLKILLRTVPYMLARKGM